DAPPPCVDIDRRIPTRELCECHLALGHEPIAPVLDAAEALGLTRIPLAAGGERGADRFRIHLAHELADVLPLTRERSAASDAMCCPQRLAQRLRQFEGRELRLGKPQQCLSKLLGGVSGALTGALARALCAPIIAVVVVRSGLHCASPPRCRRRYSRW